MEERERREDELLKHLLLHGPCVPLPSPFCELEVAARLLLFAKSILSILKKEICHAFPLIRRSRQ